MEKAILINELYKGEILSSTFLESAASTLYLLPAFPALLLLPDVLVVACNTRCIANSDTGNLSVLVSW